MQSEETQTTEPVDIPPVTGPYAEPWSLKKIIALASVFGPAAIVATDRDAAVPTDDRL